MIVMTVRITITPGWQEGVTHQDKTNLRPSTPNSILLGAKHQLSSCLCEHCGVKHYASVISFHWWKIKREYSYIISNNHLQDDLPQSWLVLLVAPFCQPWVMVIQAARQRAEGVYKHTPRKKVTTEVVVEEKSYFSFCLLNQENN